MSLIFIIAFAVCGVMALYLGKRLQRWFSFKLVGIYRLIYWVVIVFSCSLLILSLMLRSLSTYWLPLVGNFAFAAVICLIYTLFIFDIIRLLSFKRFKPNLVTKALYLICVISLFVFGHDMAMNPKIVYYQVNIDKHANVEKLRLVQLSDIHINEVTSQKFIEKMVTNVNELNADLILVTGDIIDNRLKPFIDKGFNHQFKKLQS